jgi:hypothetical protein
MTDYYIIFLLGLFVGLIFEELLSYRKKKKPTLEERVVKEYDYYKNLSQSLLQDVAELKKKNNDLLERNWKLEQGKKNEKKL